jgi:hypothetical protein
MGEKSFHKVVFTNFMEKPKLQHPQTNLLKLPLLHPLAPPPQPHMDDAETDTRANKTVSSFQLVYAKDMHDILPLQQLQARKNTPVELWRMKTMWQQQKQKWIRQQEQKHLLLLHFQLLQQQLQTQLQTLQLLQVPLLLKEH